ncbi:AraC family transcriptional regulator [Haloactinomyces albus]|uniref:AraC-like DNA-binding protein n=1 Tax=Haloactinomyces albus TaxID=1352928 RepID=A0AAE4CQI9_9ACTN|nr:AraC family transcriptional regulator [Haloactinomyces albus]MDR7302728.1 AraC-like DNA-binding protein [Haloactinomyces albus]
MYEERRSVIPGAVVWQATIPGSGFVLPDGCMDLIRTGGEVVVAGPDTRPHEVHGHASDRYVGLRFPPGSLPGLLGVPATELRNTHVPLTEVVRDSRTRSFVEQVAEAADPGRVLESFARSHPNVGQDPRTSAIVGLLREGAPVSTVADHVNLSERQLHRWSLQQFGYGPKTLARILRFRAALHLVESGLAGAVIAAHAGYADQAHLIRETRDLAGASFAALVTS